MADSPGPADPRPEDETGDSLEGALRVGFGSDSIDARRDAELALAAPPGPAGSSSHLLLRDPPEEHQPVMKPLAAGAHGSPRIGRYQMLGELGRGGMGTVMKGRDTDLGREVALKVLSDRHAGDQDRVRRFVEEAQIGGQLQHPGIVPVYEMGVGADRTPYFAMKLVNGQTLAALLEARRDPRDDQRRFLTIFEQVCQTMAYAHARGVIHRDLKPSNVMVGAFGEVQVVDWGLAKVLACGGVEDERRATRSAAEPELVETVRSRSTGSESRVGSVMGTLAYMPPEQARGEVAEVDERSDVFSLGAILCEILTGRPPYVGETADDVRDQAESGSVEDAIARLEASGADEHILRIADECLAPSKRDRLHDAGVLARNFTAYMRSVEERLRAAELAMTAAEARATAEVRTRRLTVALAGSILALFLLVAGGYWWLDSNRRTRARETGLAIDDFLNEAALSQGQARISPVEDLSRWDLAIATANKAQTLAATGAADAQTRKRIEAFLVTLEHERAGAKALAAQRERDRQMVRQLEEMRAKLVEHLAKGSQAREYDAVFRTYGIDVTNLDHEAAVKAIRAREISVRLAVALDDWAYALKNFTKSEEWKRLSRIASEADPDPWRNKWREAFHANNLDRLRELAGSPDLLAQSPATIDLFAISVGEAGHPDVALTLYQKAVEMHPGDFWLNMNLSHFLASHARPPRLKEAVGFARAGLAVRPESLEGWLIFADTLASSEDFDGAISAYTKVLEKRTDIPRAYLNLGHAHWRKRQLDIAIAHYRTAIQLRADYQVAYYNLGLALETKGDFEGAIKADREAIRLNPADPNSHTNLGFALERTGDFRGAVEAYRRAIQLKPNHAIALSNLGNALRMNGDLTEAIGYFRRAIEAKGDSADAHFDLGRALLDQGKREEAAGALRKATLIDPGHADALRFLALSLGDKKGLDEAIAALRGAIQKDPKNARLYFDLGFTLHTKKDLDGAITAYHQATKIDPMHECAFFNLGNALDEKGDNKAAEAAWRKASEIRPDSAPYLRALGTAMLKAGDLDGAIAWLQKALAIQPEDERGLNNLGITLARVGDLEGALKSLSAAIRIDPKWAYTFFHRGNAFMAIGDLDKALADFEEAARLDPNEFDFQVDLAFALQVKGRFKEALVRFRKGHDLGSSSWKERSAQWVEDCRRMSELDEKLPSILGGKVPIGSPQEQVLLAKVCHAKEHFLAAAGYWKSAFAAEPGLAREDNLVDAAVSAALAGTSAGQRGDAGSGDEESKRQWRIQSARWLRSRLDEVRKAFELEGPTGRYQVLRTLRIWKLDRRLASVRDAGQSTSSEDERNARAALWTEVDALRTRVEKKPVP